ncbi:Disulfide bond formation protein D [Anaerolineales bacterium]|nr:Disulfide bond formation protein D [Anaerolineales bacterium]
MSTKQKTSTSKLTRRQEFAIQKKRQHIINRLIRYAAGLAVIGVITFAFWPKSQTTAPNAPTSSTLLPVEVSLDKSTGEENAPVVVVEYGDFQCPACQQFFQTTVEQLKTEYVQTGKVRFVFRQFAFLGDESQWAAEASECANEQGRFWDYYDKLYVEQNGENVGVFSKDNLKQFAVDLELDATGFDQCLDSGRYAEKVKQETLEGQQSGVRGTPSVFVNGQYIENGGSFQVVKAAVEAALDK